MYIADSDSNRVRKVTVSTGIISTIAGTGSASYSGDNGQATSAAINHPTGIAVDSIGTSYLLIFSFDFYFNTYVGDVYIAEQYSDVVRKVTTLTSIITTIAGTGTGDFSGDNGAATSAALYGPFRVTLDLSGNVYIADTYNNRIRKVTVSTGIISTLAGSGTSGSFSGDDGPATSATLSLPYGVAVDLLGTSSGVSIFTF